jgi:phosphatidyl-myo-inositol dimannoside synthase
MTEPSTSATPSPRIESRAVSVLLITNDYPPRAGGIQQYCHNLMRRLPPSDVVVYAPAWEGAAEFDAAEPYRIVRHATSRMLPTRDVGGRAVELVREVRPDLVVFGAAFPLGLLARRITAETGVPCAGFTHGVEVAVAALPVLRRLLRRVARDVRLLTAVSRWSAARVEKGAAGRCRVELLPSGVDTAAYNPEVDGSEVRARHGLGDDPVCVCVSRLVPRKGQDRLIEAWPQVVARVPEARLLLVGPGPYQRKLERMRAQSPVADRIHLTGEVRWEELPAHYAAGDVFAMPCRTRAAGLEVEGWGNVFVEAAACGRPVVVGDSGGARETLVDGETGLLVDGRDVGEVAAAVGTLLAEPELAGRMGEAGRTRVLRSHTWPGIADRLAAWLREAVR